MIALTPLISQNSNIIGSTLNIGNLNVGLVGAIMLQVVKSNHNILIYLGFKLNLLMLLIYVHQVCQDLTYCKLNVVEGWNGISIINVLEVRLLGKWVKTWSCGF